VSLAMLGPQNQLGLAGVVYFWRGRRTSGKISQARQNACLPQCAALWNANLRAGFFGSEIVHDPCSSSLRLFDLPCVKELQLHFFARELRSSLRTHAEGKRLEIGGLQSAAR
jgi:hypothetical protein